MVSVIVPVHNAERHLAKCLDSILAQTHRDLEVICVDDGSTDSSGLIAYDFARRDERVTVVHKRNGGVCSARNVGLTLARGEWLTFVDDDDWIEPEMYAAMLAAATPDLDVVMCGMFEDFPNAVARVDQDTTDELTLTGREMIAQTVRMRPLSPIAMHVVWNKLYRRGAIYGGGVCFDEKIHAGEDLDFNLRVFPRCRAMKYLPTPFYHYVLHGKNTISTRGLQRDMTSIKVYRRLEGMLADDQPDMLPELYAELSRWLIRFVLKNAQDKSAANKFHAQNPETFWHLQTEIDRCPGFLDALTPVQREVYVKLKAMYEQQRGSSTC